MKYFILWILIYFVFWYIKAIKEEIEKDKIYQRKFYWLKILNIRKRITDITKNDINMAYKKLAIIYHPDKYTGSYTIMQDINQAREDALKYVENN